MPYSLASEGLLVSLQAAMGTVKLVMWLVALVHWPSFHRSCHLCMARSHSWAERRSVPYSLASEGLLVSLQAAMGTVKLVMWLVALVHWPSFHRSCHLCMARSHSWAERRSVPYSLASEGLLVSLQAAMGTVKLVMWLVALVHWPSVHRSCHLCMARSHSWAETVRASFPCK